MATKSYQITVEGVNPLICSNVQSSDPLKTESTFRAIFHTKRNKTLKDHQALQALDWIQSGYWDKQGQIDIDEDGEGDACDYNDGIGVNEVDDVNYKLIKMVDVFGREQQEHNKGVILFYIYDNGKFEKRVRH